MKFFIEFVSCLVAVAAFTALKTMNRREAREIGLRLSGSPAKRTLKWWCVAFPMGIFLNLINPINWGFAVVLAAFATGLRALF